MADYKTYQITADNGLILHGVTLSVDDPKAVVQVVHGALEHKELYFEFAEFLHNNGYAVYLTDNRGHGESVNKQYPHGHMDSIEQMAEDIFLTTDKINREYPEKDIYLFGHSLGSVIVRNYLMKHDNAIKKLVLSGTANYIPTVPIGVFLGRLIKLFNGKYGHSKLFNKIGGSTIYAPDPYETNWVTTDREFYESFLKDPLTNFAWDNSGAFTVFKGDQNLKAYQKYQCKNKELSILSVTGSDDPVTGGDKGLEDTFETLRRIGYSDIRSIVYLGKKHAVLFETNRKEVMKDILTFFEKK